MTSVYVSAPTLIAEGIENWSTAKAILQGSENYNPQPLIKYKPTLLPPNERRRATTLVRLAFQVCEQCLEASEFTGEQLASVFASSGGDDDIVDQICLALLQPERPVSPTQFHNSVHNSASGYWSIATQSNAISQSVSAGQATYIEGLLEAMMLAISNNIPVMFVGVEHPAPEALFEGRGVRKPFAGAMVLSAAKTNQALAKITLTLNTASANETTMDDTLLEQLRQSSPVAKALPLLQALVRDNETTLNFDGANQSTVQVHCQPL